MSAIVEKRNLAAELETSFLQGDFAKSPGRKKAFEAFLSKGLPDSKREEYKFTPVTRVLEKVFEQSSPADLKRVSAPSLLFPGLNCHIITFVNGAFSKELSVLHDSEIEINLTEENLSSEESDPFALLNQAFHPHAVEISIAKGKILKHPIAFTYWFDSAAFVFANPRWNLKLDQESSATIIEHTSGPGTSFFNNKNSRIEVGENASLEHVVIQHHEQDVHVNNTTLHISKSGRVSSFCFTGSGKLVRNNLNLIVDGENIDAHLYGLYLLSGTTIADNHTVVDHRKPNSFSNELYKGVMSGNSKGVFNGKIYVRPDAQKTNAFQSNRNILLGDSASVNTKPQLEIWADDVKCSHGCTTGQLDEEALFYLQSRGINKEMARSMLLKAFAAETIASLKNEIIREFLESLITEKLIKSF